MKKLLVLIVVFCLSIFISSCKQGQSTLKVGDVAPDFSLVDRQGKTWTLSELRGQVVFINFWATWCPPCLKELPSMQNLYAKIPKDKFKMLAVLNKDKPARANFIANQKNFTFTILDDEQNVVGAKYFLTGLPETFIVDKQGIIREKVIGPAQWDAPGSVQMIKNVIGE